MSSLTITQVASLAARREAQKARVRHLYRRALRHSLCWFGKPDFYDEATKLRQRFEVNKHVADLENIERLLVQAEGEFHQKQHPDPYISPWAPNGNLWQRNAPVPPETSDVKTGAPIELDQRSWIISQISSRVLMLLKPG